MIRVLILVEGFTEETFVKRVLAPYLLPKGIALQCTVITTKKIVDGPNKKGGITDYGKFRRDVLKLLNDSDVAAVTTLIDFYGIPDDFPGRRTIPVGTSSDRVLHMEESIGNSIANDRFIPFLALHEFEAFLFVDPSIVQEMFPDENCLEQLTNIRDSFDNPEEINESPLTAPSKRLNLIFGNQYQKVTHGPLVTGVIGIDRIRAECPHFDNWLSQLEALVADSA